MGMALDKNGQNLSLVLYTYTSRPELTLYMQRQCRRIIRKLVLDVQIKIVDYSMLDELAKTGDYDLLVSSVVTANTGDPVWFLKQYWGSNIDGDNPNNGSGFNNSRFDELTALAGSTLDATIARNAIINAQQILLDENATIFLAILRLI